MFTLAAGVELSEQQVRQAVEDQGLDFAGFRIEEVAVPPAVYLLDVSSFPT